MQFDARAAKSLQPGQHITIDGYPGLRLQARETSRTWTYRYKSPVDGRMRQIKLGQWPAMSLPAAIVAWEGLRTQREAGEDPAMAARAVRAEVAEKKAAVRERKGAGVRTVRQVCNFYLEGHVKPNRKKKGADEIGRTFNTMLGEVGDMDAVDVTRSVAFDLIQSYAAIPVQASSLRRELGAAWDFALDAGKLPENTPNWWRLILRGKLRSKGKVLGGERQGVSPRALSPDEVGTLIRWLPNLSSLVEDALTLYLWTAVRGAEIVAIEGAEITDESTGLWWTIPKRKTKNARHPTATDHRVPLYGRAAEVVRRRIEVHGDGFLFPSYGKLGHSEQKAVSLAVWYHQPYCTSRPEMDRPRLPVTHWAPHDLRRTSRTLLAALGCPRDTAEVIVGHMLPGVEGTYNRHTYDAERQEWLKRLSDHLEQLAARR